ncbi:MAG TPA: cyclopropane-fatty-acyl-phospholipid synthase family protein [Steroidobacteraceae bacterium]|nr:cyclopropane-fatty-acyl-phospholipid synthase family protein [Steroidobacteraceae bacterium]
MLLSEFAKRAIKEGDLTIIDAAGRRHRVGDGRGRTATVRLHDKALHHRLAINPFLRLGEAYMEGTLTIEQGSLYHFLDICARNVRHAGAYPLTRVLGTLERLLRRVHQYNPMHRARANAAHHYDLSDTLYGLFLDADRQYSCAYFTHPHDDLEQAQQDKKRHLAAKLLLKPGVRVLDIGSGWGGLGLYLAEAGAAQVVGITLSEEQLKVSRERARGAALDDRVRFELCDYRALRGTFDRIVSVGMFEHVGVRHYSEFFAALRDLLAEDGIAVLHSIGRADGPGVTNPWIRKYIFPGGYAPALSEVLPVVERLGLWVTDVEILRLHYAETLRLWRRRFQANRARIAKLYDERFCRMWEWYLIASELAFRRLGHMVFQLQLAKRQDAVPLTRDYVTEWERRRLHTAIAAE